MSLPHRHTGALVAGALAATALSIPFAAPASAATTGAVFTVADTDGDFSYGLYRRLGDAAPVAVVPETATVDVDDLTVSRDGSRIAYSESVYDSNGGFVTTRLAVRDASGRLVRVVRDATKAQRADVGDLALSPDGRTVVWVESNQTTFTTTLRRADVTTGATTTLPGTAFDFSPVFLTPSLLLVSDGTTTRTVALTGGSHTAVAGAPVNSGDFTVSPDGSTLAWTADTTPDTADISTADIRTATLSVSGSTATLSNTTTLVTGQDNSSPTFSPTTDTVQFVRYDGDAGEGDVGTVATTGGSATFTTTNGADEYEVAAAVVDDIAPGAPVLGAPVLSGSTASLVAAGLPEDVSGLVITRHSSAGTTYLPVPVSPTGAFTLTGLTVGTAYDLVVQAVDRSGNVGPASNKRYLVATAAPLLTAVDPTSTPSAGLPFTVTFGSAANRTTTKYTVDYRQVAVDASYKRWVTGSTSTKQTFGYTNKPVAVPQGSVWQFRGQATDYYGNVTAVTTSGKAVVPFNQTRATISTAATTAGGSDRFLGDARFLYAAGQKAVLSVTGDRLQVIGERSTTGGRFDVYLKNPNGTFTRIGYHVDTYATARKARQVLFTTTPGTVATRTYEIRWVAGPTTARKVVALDAFGVRR